MSANAADAIDFYKFIPLVTGLAAITFAAYSLKVTSRNAENARKQDILYKERYKSYEVLAEYLFDIVRNFDKYQLSGYEPLSQAIYGDTVKIIKESKEIIESEPNRRHLTLFSDTSKEQYYEVLKQIKEVDTISNKVMSLINTTKLMIDVTGDERHKGFRGTWARLDSAVQDLILKSNKCHESIRKDLSLPEK